MSERHQVLQDAIAKGDVEIITALCAAPKVLTGLDERFVSDMKSTYEARVAPGLVAELNATLEADAALTAALRSAEHVAAESQHAEYLEAIEKAAAAWKSADATLEAMDR